MDPETARRQVAAIRQHTVANGATPEAAANAERLAQRLEQRYGLRDEGPAAGRSRSAAHDRRPRGNRVILSAAQYRTLQRGQTVTKTQLGEAVRYRIEAGVLCRLSDAGGETRHEILAAQPSCGNVIIRYI